MDTMQLSEAVRAYEAQIGALENLIAGEPLVRFVRSLPSRIHRGSDASVNLKEQVVHLLRARDDVRSTLAQNPQLTLDEMLDITGLDQRLRAIAPSIVARVGPDTLAAWRDMWHPSDRAWWWRLDIIASRQSANSQPVATFIVRALMFLINAILVFEIGRRFLQDVEDIIAVIGLTLTVSTALLAGLAASGQRMERLLARQGVGPRFVAGFTTGMTAFVCLALVVFWLSLPVWSEQALQSGNRAMRDERFNTAAGRFRLAANLNPENTAALYNLALTYEQRFEYEKAIEAYKAALGANTRDNLNWSFATYNNLARLYMLHRDDFGSAYRLMDDIITHDRFAQAEACLDQQRVSQCEASADDVYKFYKNRGWANLGLGDLEGAEADLTTAIAVRQLLVGQGDMTAAEASPASATCLLAQLREQQGDLAAAERDYHNCLSYAGVARNDPAEKEWLVKASRFVNGMSQ